MRRILPAAFIALTFTHVQAADRAHPYLEHWKRATFGKIAVAGVAAGAAIGQLEGHPRNYGGGVLGFGKRLGSGLVTHTVGTTVEHAVAARLHEDIHYQRSEESGFVPRLGHALTSTVVTHNTETGDKTPAVGRLSGHAAAGVMSQIVLHAGSGVATAGIGMAAEAGANVVREFWPRKKQ